MAAREQRSNKEKKKQKAEKAKDKTPAYLRNSSSSPSSMGQHQPGNKKS